MKNTKSFYVKKTSKSHISLENFSSILKVRHLWCTVYRVQSSTTPHKFKTTVATAVETTYYIKLPNYDMSEKCTATLPIIDT